jgi:hypothetical protein
MSSSADDAAPAPWTVKDVLEHLGAASSSARVRSSMRDIDGALAAYAKGIARVLDASTSRVPKEALEFLREGVERADDARAVEDKILALRRAMDRATDCLMNPKEPKDMYEAEVGAQARERGETVRLMSFASAAGGDDAKRWRALNDGVMGGMSDGFFMSGERGANFVGNVSLERNGGFASVRAAVEEDGEAYDGIYVDVVAAEDNASKTWLFILKDDLCMREQMNFKTAFKARGELGRVKLPFDAFNRPERMGRAMYREPLRTRMLREFGFMILKGDDVQVGRFALGIAEIGFYRD